ncbi:MAG TPA: ornithine cyclodeaminase family protein [Candidatus Marinimicrobia bacterium]|nr:ornithine cyclodeaminase family protein [Candidatus Neomarinimicrobiota bacterium]
MVILNKNQINKLVTMNEAIVTMKTAFVQLSKREANIPVRLSTDIPGKNATSLVMPAYLLDSPYYTVKVVSVNYSNPQKGLPLLHSSVQVFDASKGNIVATLDGESITAIRTGAVSGLATGILAKKDAKVGAIFGTGVQAKSQVEAILFVKNLEKILVFSRTKESAELFCNLIYDTFGIKASTGNKDSLKEADVICTATPSKKPLFDHSDLNLGVHINAIGSFKPHMQEIGIETVINSKVIVDNREACEVEAGDLIIPVEEKKWSFNLVHGELGQVILGEVSGRDSDDEITLFKSVGNAIQDLALANLIMKKLNHDSSK